MADLEDLEEYLENGINDFAKEILLKEANRMGLRIVAELKKRTPVVTGKLRRSWTSDVVYKDGEVWIVIKNNTEYAAAYNYGRRVVRNGKTFGYVKGKHIVERVIHDYMNTLFEKDVQRIVHKLGDVINGGGD